MKLYKRKFKDSKQDIYDDRRIIDTKHSLEKFYDRYISIQKSTIIRILSDAIEKIINEHNDESLIYGIYSKSTGICSIVNWRRDHLDDDGRNHAIIITMPPPKRNIKNFHLTSPKDVMIIVESLLLDSIDKKILTKLSEQDNRYIQKYNYEGLEMYYEDGKIFDYGIGIYILID